MQVTWLDSNSWLLDIAGKRVLVDPWLVGPLVFGNQSWLFKGEHPHPCPLPESIDLILLSQGLEDHAHPPTLAALDHSIPVVGSPNAAKVVEELGYRHIIPLDHGETFTLEDTLSIKAVPGSPIGPALLENGYILRDLQVGKSVFYEPHGFHQPSLKEEGDIDVVITPVLDLALPFVGPVIRGQKGAMELVSWLNPQVVLPTADAGEVEYSGLLISILKAIGGPDAMQRAINQAGYSAQVLNPRVGQALTLDLKPRSAAVT
jgi:L-ascorbate metabolism protein UlaG (beta-lactamase superfamily)